MLRTVQSTLSVLTNSTSHLCAMHLQPGRLPLTMFSCFVYFFLSLVGWFALLCFDFGFCYHCYCHRVNVFLSLGLHILICKMGHWIKGSLLQCCHCYQYLISLLLVHTAVRNFLSPHARSRLLLKGPGRGDQPLTPGEHANGGHFAQLQLQGLGIPQPVLCPPRVHGTNSALTFPYERAQEILRGTPTLPIPFTHQSKGIY